MELVKKDDKSTRENKTRAEIDILGNILQENAETLTFTKHKCVQNNSYNEFKKRNQARWGNIAYLIRRLEKLLASMKHDYGSSGWEFDAKKDLDVV